MSAKGKGYRKRSARQQGKKPRAHLEKRVTQLCPSESLSLVNIYYATHFPWHDLEVQDGGRWEQKELTGMYMIKKLATDSKHSFLGCSYQNLHGMRENPSPRCYFHLHLAF